MFLLFSGAHAFAQYKKETDATIPLDMFYVKRHGPGLLRGLLSKLNVGLSTGYGATTFKHEFEGITILQQPDSLPKIFVSNSPTNAYSNWFNKSVTANGNSGLPGTFLVNSDTAKIGFKSRSFHLPLRATVHVEFNRYRLGGGYSYEFTKVGDFNPLSYGASINSFSPDFSSFFLKKYFVLFGASVYRYNDYLLSVDANIGGFSLGKNFDKANIKKGVLINLGATVEREMSEYFKLFVRPSYELRNYALNIPEGGPSIKHRFNAFYLNIGATYRLPELRRCFSKDCRVQINHAHGNREYRSRVHPIYKKQNPHYGENYPSLIKYKGKNKRKLNPY